MKSRDKERDEERDEQIRIFRWLVFQEAIRIERDVSRLRRQQLAKPVFKKRTW